MFGRMLGRRGTFSYGGALFALACALPLAAQTPAPPVKQPNPAPTAPAAAAVVKHHKKSAAKQPVEPPSPPAPTVAPSRFQEAASPAVVSAGGNQLTVKADNSSLSQILHQVSSQTGMQLDGMSGDERVFGSFGPGAPREVLTALLDGTGYNMMMVGNLPNGAPRELLLSRRASAAGAAAAPAPSPTPNQNGESDNPDDQDPQDFQEAPSPPSIMPAEPPPGAPQPPPGGRTPQEMIQQQIQNQNVQPQ